MGSTALLRSPLLSLVVCVALAAVTGIVVMALSLTGGVPGPNGDRVL
jgi:hypothetical protein